MKSLLTSLGGFLMALADSVPGVSGGTIAFILGFYDRFIGSLDQLIYGDKPAKLSALKFLLRLGLGWAVGMISAVLILTNLFETNIYATSSLFLGFIIFSLPFIIRQEKSVLKGHYQGIIFLLLGCALVALITYFNPVSSAGMDITALSPGLFLYIFLAGLVAISSMILPGISGSTLLLIFGLYIPIITGVKDVLHLHFASLPALIAFGLGVLAGVALVIRLVKIALERYRSATIYCIIGLMLGSLYAITMGPTTLDTPLAPLSLATFSPLFFLLGGAVIFALEWLRGVFARKASTSPKEPVSESEQ